MKLSAEMCQCIISSCSISDYLLPSCFQFSFMKYWQGFTILCEDTFFFSDVKPTMEGLWGRDWGP